MNHLEQRLNYVFGEQLPAPGSSMEVAPGVRWIRMSLPFALNHINLWLLRDEMELADGSGKAQGWTVVDCCVDRPESRAQWEQIIADEMQGLPVLRVIATHMHPDHLGLAHWLCERFEARLWISSTDYNVANIASRSDSGWGGESASRFLVSHGLSDKGSVEGVAKRSSYYSGLVPAVPRKYRRMQDGDIVHIGGKDWRCISGYGHAPEHISLHCEALGLLIGGDMMLPRISTNVSVFDTEPESDPLRLFLESIDKFRVLDEETLTLPSHGKPFRGLHERIDQLHAHHRERLDEVLQACSAKPCNAHDMLPFMFKRKLDLHETTFAMGEAVAHMHMLWFAGKLRRKLDADGIYRFTTV